jgi:hypothetical protein
MILCRKRNFLFLRVPKTASTSVSHHLIKFIPKDEIDEFWGTDFLLPEDGYKFERDPEKQTISWHEKKSKVFPHATKKEIINAGILSEEDLRNLNFFAVIRHPIEKFLSAVNMLLVEQNKGTFRENINDEIEFYLDKINNKTLTEYESTFLKPQSNWVDDGVQLIKFPHFSDFFRSINVPHEMPTSRRIGQRNNHSQFSNMGSSLFYRVKEIYQEDFEIWKSL